MTNGPQTPNAQYLHATKYRAPGESFDEAMNRIAGALTENTQEFHTFREIIRDMRFLPGGRVQAAVGAPKQVTPYNCFVSGDIHDSFVEGNGSIMARATEAAQTMRLGGGIGYDFSELRPRGATIKKLGSVSSGPVAFMEIFDAICKCIASSGHRRGAQMGVLRVDHPDIEEFIHAKQNTDRLTGFNVSIGVTDEFMVAVRDGTPFSLRWKGEVHNTINARALWEKIMRSTWDWAEPGVLFVDRINSANNLWYAETIAATNPCFTGDTKVWTAEHGHVPFRELVGKTVQVLTEAGDGRAVYRRMSNIRKTGVDAQLVEVQLDNGTSVRCTPSHKFFLKDGTAKPAQDLRAGDALKGVYRYKANQKGYLRLTNGQHDPLEHHIPFEDVEGLGRLVHAHHKNEVRSDNRPSNLELLEASEHLREHKSGDKNPLRTHQHRNPMLLDPDCTRGEKNGRWREDLSTERMLEMRENGMSFAQISEECGCSKYTVQKRIRDANHRVVGVTWLEDREDVYCGTVDDPTHRFIVATGDNDGVLVANCGEQPLPPYGACLLGSFNLNRYVSWVGDNDHEPSDSGWQFDWQQFRADIPKVVRAMDRVVDVATYPLFEQELEAHNKRRMGLGVTALANAGETLGFPYGSDSFLVFEEQVLTVLRDEAYLASANLAAGRGSFPLFDRDKYLGGDFVQTLPEEVRDAIAKHGMRNSHLLSIAPTGTISLTADNCSSGIEPVFAKSVNRTIQTFDGPMEARIEDWAFANRGVQPVEASEVSAQDHLRVLALAQRLVDSSVSKTCNVPSDMPWDQFKAFYFRAWELGCKGCTTFQTGGKRAGIVVKDEGSSCYVDAETGRHECE